MTGALVSSTSIRTCAVGSAAVTYTLRDTVEIGGTAIQTCVSGAIRGSWSRSDGFAALNGGAGN